MAIGDFDPYLIHNENEKLFVAHYIVSLIYLSEVNYYQKRITRGTLKTIRRDCSDFIKKTKHILDAPDLYRRAGVCFARCRNGFDDQFRHRSFASHRNCLIEVSRSFQQYRLIASTPQTIIGTYRDDLLCYNKDLRKRSL